MTFVLLSLTFMMALTPALDQLSCSLSLLGWVGYCGFFDLGPLCLSLHFGLCNGKTVFANHNHIFMQASCIVSSCLYFNVQDPGHDSWWIVVNVRSFLSFVIIHCLWLSQKRKRKGKNLRERKKLLFQIACPKRGRYLKILYKPMSFPWSEPWSLVSECLRHGEKHKGKLYFFFFFISFMREEKRREEEERAERDSNAGLAFERKPLPVAIRLIHEKIWKS